MINKLPQIKLNKPLILALLILIPVQLVLPIRSIALYLVEDLNIPFNVLASFEMISVPITVAFLSAWLIQKLNWSWLTSSRYISGFFLSIPFFWILPRILIHFEAEEIVFRIIDIAGAPISLLMPILGDWHLLIYFGLRTFFALLVTLPILSGLLTSLVVYLYKKRNNYVT